MIEDRRDAAVAGQLATTLLAVDPVGLGGLHLCARAGPTRDAFLQGMPKPATSTRKIAPTIDDTQLFGGVDIAATLAESRVVTRAGLLAEPCQIVLSMAERCPQGLAARLGQALDSRTGHNLVLLDEGIDDETAPASLTERLAFRVDLDGLRAADLAEIVLEPQQIEQARLALPEVDVPDDLVVSVTVAAARFGIDTLRAPLFALAAMRAHAALSGRQVADGDDARLAAQLVYTHRATMIPQDDDDVDDAPPPEQDDTPEGTSKDDSTSSDLPAELLIEAVKALLPPEVISALEQPGGARSGKGAGGAGQKKRGNRRGRPLPSRSGRPSSTARIDLIATLRAAAPWQPIRRKLQPDRSGILVRPSDIRIRQFQEMSDRLIIFAVDASGSSAMARLGEAKGAVELMLGEAYARRDHVALVAFRGDGAEVVLPPTRSLVQTKRRLAGLPGGGGTPLAAGLKTMTELARHAQGRGLSPALAILTDGRANVPLAGRTGRAAALEDAQSMARVVRSLSLPAAFVDTSVRPHRDLRSLAALMGAAYVALPRADAQSLSTAVGSALGE